MTMASTYEMMVSVSLLMYHLPHVCRTLVPEIRVHPKMLRVLQHINVLTSLEIMIRM